MKRRFVVYRDGFRYWATKSRLHDGRIRFTFWSSHDWPFYHGHYTPDRVSSGDVWNHFLRWIPKGT